MANSRRGCGYVLTWPFRLVWQLVTGILALTGRLVAAILGIVFMVVGLVLTSTVIGAILGVPLLIVGFLLMLRALF